MIRPDSEGYTSEDERLWEAVQMIRRNPFEYWEHLTQNVAERKHARNWPAINAYEYAGTFYEDEWVSPSDLPEIAVPIPMYTPPDSESDWEMVRPPATLNFGSPEPPEYSPAQSSPFIPWNASHRTQVFVERSARFSDYVQSMLQDGYDVIFVSDEEMDYN